jgi:hypothetical protein
MERHSLKSVPLKEGTHTQNGVWGTRPGTPEAKWPEGGWSL